MDTYITTPLKIYQYISTNKTKKNILFSGTDSTVYLPVAVIYTQLYLDSFSGN